VANILTAHGVSHIPTLQAALLHDTVEDTETTIEELTDVFGSEVAGIVLVRKRERERQSEREKTAWLQYHPD
jgi:(p)ppGpp synthase/HD superfamily hydrolase